MADAGERQDNNLSGLIRDLSALSAGSGGRRHGEPAGEKDARLVGLAGLQKLEKNLLAGSRVVCESMNSGRRNIMTVSGFKWIRSARISAATSPAGSPRPSRLITRFPFLIVIR